VLGGYLDQDDPDPVGILEAGKAGEAGEAGVKAMIAGQLARPLTAP